MAGMKPNPDPSTLTTEQLDKAIAGATALTSARFDSVEVRLDAMDKAVDLVHSDFVRVPTVVDRAIQNLRELLDERIHGRIDLLSEKIKGLGDVTTQQFKSIDDKFAEKDKAVSVGLSAQKESAAAQQDSNTEATRKMEDNFTKLLDQGRELLAEVRRNTDMQLGDIKSRLDRGEGTSVGHGAARVEHREERVDGRAMMFSSIGVGLGVAAILTTVLMHVIK